MADFSKGEDVERWLKARPEATRQRDATILASRATLRVWPVLALELGQRSERRFAELSVSGARANAVAWAAAKYPARANELRAAAADAAALAADATAAVAVAAAAAAVVASDAADATLAAAQAVDASAAAAAAAAYDSASNASAKRNAVAAGDAVWLIVSTDATALETRAGALSLLDCPLWGEWSGHEDREGRHIVTFVPQWLTQNWSRLKSLLLERSGENWQVWLDWYDAVLNGRPPWPRCERKAAQRPHDQDRAHRRQNLEARPRCRQRGGQAADRRGARESREAAGAK
jgi:hypothetical protein